MLRAEVADVLSDIGNWSGRIGIGDLTGPLEPGMWGYGNDILSQMNEPPAQGTAACFRMLAGREQQGWEAHTIELTTLTGTYLETGTHLFPGFPAIDELPLESFFKQAVFLEIPKGAGEPIISDDLEDVTQSNPIMEKDAVIVHTGWGRNWSSPRFECEGPFFSKDAMDHLIAKGISLLACDTPRFDSIKAPAGVVQTLLRSGALLLAPIMLSRNIGSRRCLLIVLPLKLKGLCASPSRALILYEKDD